MKKILLSIILSITLLFNTLVPNLKVQATDPQDESFELEIETYSITGAIGVGYVVGKYIMQALTVAGLATFTESVANPNSHLNVNMQDIQTISEVLWDFAGPAIQSSIIQSWDLAVSQGQNTFVLSQDLLNWFTSAFMSTHASLIQNVLLQNNDIQSYRVYLSGQTQSCGNQSNSSFFSCSTTIALTADNQFITINPNTGLWQRIGATGTGTRSVIVDFPLRSSTGGRVRFTGVDSTLQSIFPSTVTGIDVGIAVFPDFDGVFGSAIINRTDVIRVLEGNFPLIFVNRSDEILSILNGLDAVGNINDVTDNSNREIAIPLDDIIPRLDGFPLEWDSERGLWVWPDGTPVNEDRVADFTWDMPLPGITDGVWDRSVPPIEGETDTDTDEEIPIPIPPGELPDIPDVPIVDSIIGGIQAILDFLHAIFTTVLETIISIPSTIIDAILLVVEAVMTLPNHLLQLGQNIVLGLGSVVGTVAGTIGQIGAVTHGLLSDIIASILELAMSLGMTLSDILVAVMTMAQTLGATLVDILVNILGFPAVLAEVFVDLFVLPAGSLTLFFENINGAVIHQFPVIEQLNNLFSDMDYQQQTCLPDVSFDVNLPFIGRFDFLVSMLPSCEIVPTFRRWLSAFMYTMTLFFVYRKSSHVLGAGK